MQRLNWVLCGTGGFAAALGIVVLAGWHTHSAALIQGAPSSAAMVYNAALGFLLGGTAMVAVGSGRPSLAAITGSFITIIGLVTLYEYLFAVNLGIDQWLMTDYFTTPDSATPGRMALTSALGFTLIGAAIIVMSDRTRPHPPRLPWSSLQAGIVGLLGTVVAMLGLVNLVLYLTGLMTSYGWGRISRIMAVHTAIGLIMVGTGILTWAWQKSRETHRSAPRWLPFLVGAGVVTATLLLWQALLVQEHLALERTIQLTTAQVKSELVARMDARILALTRLATRWERWGKPVREEWATDAELVLRDFPGFQAISWLDPSFHVRWIIPLLDNETAIGFYVASDERRRSALEAARARHAVMFSRMVDLAQGGKGFVAFVPVFESGQLAGMIGGVFRPQVLFDTLLQTVAPGYALTLFEGDEELYRRGPVDQAMDTEWSQETSMPLSGVTWQVRVWPQPRVLAQARSALPGWGLGAGLLFALLLAATVFFAQTTRRQTRYVERINHDLNRENAERKRLEEAIRESEARYRAVSELSSDYAFFQAVESDGTMRYVWITDAFTRLTGYTIEDLRQMGWQASFYPQDRPFGEQQFRAAVANQEDVREFRLQVKDGTVRWVRQHVRPLWDGKQSRVAGVYGAGQDITEHRQKDEALRESEERFRRAFHNAATGMALVALDGRFLQVNPAMCEIVGYTAQELLATTFQVITHPDDRETNLDIIHQALRGETQSYQIEKRYLHKQGQTVWASVNGSVIRDAHENPLYVIAQVQDVTRRKQAEDTVRTLNSQLEERVRERTAALARANADLRQLAYVSAHDLQEPVRMVTTYIQLVARRYQDKLDSDADQFIGYAIEGATRMHLLLNDLLAYLQVEMKEQEFVDTDCEVVLETALSSLRQAIKDTGATVTHDPLPTVWANASQLSLVFQNLIDNALKFHDSSPPRVHIWAEPHDGAWLFAVRDDGIGIEPQYTERIFTMFERLHTRMEYPGTGMGLTLCKKIVEQHGGRIWLESVPGKGSVFLFTVSGEREKKVQHEDHGLALPVVDKV